MKRCADFSVSGRTINCQPLEAHLPVLWRTGSYFIRSASVRYLCKPLASCCSRLVHPLNVTVKSWRENGEPCGLLISEVCTLNLKHFHVFLSGAVISPGNVILEFRRLCVMLINTYISSIWKINTNLWFCKNK